MKKIISWVSENIMFVLTLFLLAFIPLYPKIPLLDIKNTWVYVRAEDFIVLFALFLWLALLFRKKITLKTPLTVPIMVFWITGAISTLHGVILIFPNIANVFPNVAFLNYVRHIEYVGVFFIAFAAMKDKKFLSIAIAVLVATLLGIIAYGFGQKYFGLPAYLTMNEEFAKGIPIQLSSLGRVPSTFAGHYDLAAYLVLVLPIIAGLFFGFRNWFIKIGIAVTLLLGIALLFLTVSRVSFVVLFISLFLVLIMQSKRLLLLFIPGIIAGIFLLFYFQPNLLNRFGNTVQETNVLVSAGTGEAIGNVNFVPYKDVKSRVIQLSRVRDKEDLNQALVGETGKLEEVKIATPSGKPVKPPTEVPLVTADNISTGETLPQGTGYINLSLSPVTKRLANFYYELPVKSASKSADVVVLYGDFLIKRAAAYDLSFTTRFQGEWPKALAMFEKNIFLGSGYGSVSLSVDNNYFRMLGEIGLFGIISFFSLFLLVGIYINKILPDVNSKVARNFVLGFSAGVIGLALNATLIDVFEASKVAFTLWILTGITLGILVLYQTKSINIYRELTKALVSPYAVLFYLIFLTIFIFSPLISNYFVGDDFTWFRWAADNGGILKYFTDSEGFFFRPGTKIYFLLMYQVFWLNQVVYHVVSIFLHFIVTALFFLLAKRILKDNTLSALSAFLFLIMSGYAEEVFWISATGHLFNAAFALAALLLFILWEEKKKLVFLIGSIISIIFSMLFHELGIVIPVLLIAYKAVFDGPKSLKEAAGKIQYWILFLPIIVYLLFRAISGSHWLSGDYSYNLLKLPFNITGNIIGYILLTYFGPLTLSFYETLRSISRDNIVLSGAGMIIVLSCVYLLYKNAFTKLNSNDKKILVFGFLFFIICLGPFIGLGNITSRYSYLASLGLILILVLLFKKIHSYLVTQGRDIAILGISLVIGVYSLFHIIQVQKIHGDWRTAGIMSKNFFVSIDGLYTDSWSKEPANLHFVNVPIRTGDAWVFPVGLSDALWFTFQNDNLRVFIHPDLDSALDSAGVTLSDRIFEFNPDGSVKEYTRYIPVIPPVIKK